MRVFFFGTAVTHFSHGYIVVHPHPRSSHHLMPNFYKSRLFESRTSRCLLYEPKSSVMVMIDPIFAINQQVFGFHVFLNALISLLIAFRAPRFTLAYVVEF